MNMLLSYPDWWENKEKSDSGYTFFYKSVKGASAYLARLGAYEAILDDISKVLQDENLKSQYISEFVLNNTIDVFSLQIEALNLYRYSNNEIECIVKAKAKTSALFSKIVDSKEFEEDMKKVDRLYNEGRLLYRTNNDIESLDKFLEAILIVEKYPHLSASEEFNYISDRILRIVKNAYIEVSNINRKNASCILALKRNVGIIHPSIEKGDIEVLIPSFLGGENSISYTTGPGGVIKFSLVIYDSAKSGEIVFKIKEPSLLSRLESEQGVALRNAVRETLEENAVKISYNLEREENLFIDTLISFLDTNGIQILLPNSLEKFRTTLEENSIEVSFNDVKEDLKIASDVINDYVNSNIDNHSRFVLSVIGAIDDITTLGNDRAMHMNFDVCLKDTETNKVLFQSENLDGISTGKNERETLFNVIDKTLNYISKTVSERLKGEF